MDKNIKMKHQIEEVRETLNNKLLQDILNKGTMSMDTLNLSWKLDKLIVDYMKKGILDK
ncbi:aspartyl-phosphate phosphatase Spo0E family protein [Clostridium sp. BJN0013]|uniref:aspartyl-phosphate phosphatase Spo0E family protein n=1 Tax=Clostridium sp. BJN0013 TaxID=3236840 RepID=UPI0034C62ADB